MGHDHPAIKAEPHHKSYAPALTIEIRAGARKYLCCDAKITAS